MNYETSLKKALNDYGPVRKGHIYRVVDKKDFYNVIVCGYKKYLEISIKKEDINFEDYTVTSVNFDDIKDMLTGKRYVEELCDSTFYEHKLTRKSNFTKDNLYELLDSFGKTIYRTSAGVFIDLYDMYLKATVEGNEAITAIFSLEDEEFNKIESKISAILFGLHLYFVYTGAEEIEVAEVKRQLEKSIELSNNNESGIGDLIIFKLYRNYIDDTLAAIFKDEEFILKMYERGLKEEKDHKFTA